MSTVLLTALDDPKELLSSQYGIVTYRKWCLLEVARIRSAGKRATIVESNGLVAVGRPTE